MPEPSGAGGARAHGQHPPLPAAEGGEPLAGADAYSKDYWDIVFDQLGRRPLFRVGLSVLALLYAVAIYAPLIANDRPYVLEAIDLGEYEAAVRSISAVTSSVVRLVEQTPDEYLAARGDVAAATLDEALAAEEAAARQRLVALRRALAVADQQPLDAYQQRLGQALGAARAGERERAALLGGEAKQMARELRSSLKPRDPTDPDSAGVSLVGRRQYPLLESIGPWEVFFMVLWLWVLTWPAWNMVVNRWLLHRDRRRIRVARRAKFGAALTSSALAATLWFVSVGGDSSSLASAPYKLGLSQGDIVLQHGDWSARRAPVFAPLPMGYAETHPEEGFRPPTWTRAAKMDSEGRYLFGARRTEADVMGILPSADPVVVRYGEPETNSAMRHLAGTDQLGRDFLVRMIWGSRVSLSVGILSALLLTLIGVTVGALAGYAGGRVDSLIMRVIEILQSIPAFFLIIVAMAFTDPDVVPPIFAIVFVIAIIRWTAVARLVRGEFLKLREAEFVVAARALGFTNRRTIFRHILPNALSPVLVSTAFAVAAGILTESAVSYLGFGIQHPGASWGSLVNESKSADHWWVQFFPGLLIFVTVTCYNLVGDAIRDALDPKMKLES